MKYIIVFLLSIFINNAHSQIADFLEENQLTTDDNTIVLFITDKECSNCYIILNNAVSISQKNPKLNFNYVAVTDNYSFAKNVLKNLNISGKIIFNKDIFYAPEINRLNTIYLRSHDQEYFFNKTNYNSESLNSIINGNQSHENCYIDMGIVDSTLGHDLFSYTFGPSGIKIFDKVLQNCLHINCNSGQYEMKISKPQLTDSMFFYRFPDRVEKNHFDILESELMFSTLKEKNLDFLYVNTISEYDNHIYCVFSLKRLYKKKNEDQYGLFTTYFIAVKDITEKDEDIMNLNGYSNYFYIDSFLFEETTYPVGHWIGFHPKFIDNNTIQLNVQKLDKDNKMSFGGLATIKLDFKSNTTQMITIDNSAPETIYIDHTINIEHQPYILKKEMTDESRALGIIKLEKK